jgi:cell division protein FtsB
MINLAVVILYYMAKLREVNFKPIIYIFLIIFFGLSLVRSVSKVGDAKKRIENAKIKVEKLEAEQKSLEEELKKVQSDEYMQRQLRDKLGLAKEGEIVVILPDEEALKGLVPPIPEEEDVLPDPIFRRWAKLFGI